MDTNDQGNTKILQDMQTMLVIQIGYPEAGWIVPAITYAMNAIRTNPHLLSSGASRR